MYVSMYVWINLFDSKGSIIYVIVRYAPIYTYYLSIYLSIYLILKELVSMYVYMYVCMYVSLNLVDSKGVIMYVCHSLIYSDIHSI